MKHRSRFFKIAAVVGVLTFVFYLLPFNFSLVSAEIDCLNAPATASDAEYCGTQLQDLINKYLPAQNTNKKNLAGLQSQLVNINKRISVLMGQINTLTANISQRQEDLAYAREILNRKAVTQYKNSRLYNPFLALISATDATEAFRIIKLMGFVAEGDRKIIGKYGEDLLRLKNDQDILQKTKDSLAVSQKQVADQTSFLAAEVAKVDSYLAQLSAKQSAFIAAKLDSLGLSRSAYNMKGGCSDDRNVDPGFSPRIAFFSFGVPNRIGMNQFGAKGRAESGQNAESILKAYYNADYTTGYNQGINIHVTGTNEFGQSFDNTWSIEEYLTHLYEMPTDFPMEALKAQAIAARSYALAVTNNGAGSICPSQQCQVVKSGAHDNDRWTQAVHDTAGIVMATGGNPIKAWFSSTHGGYAYTSADIGWSGTSWTKRMQDTTGGVGGFSDLMSNAYDKSSPVFYCDWGSRPAYNKTAWLKPDELADIANVIMLAKKDGSTQSHLAQLDKANPDGTDTWDAGRVRTELANRGGSPISSATDVSIGADFGSGKTTTVNINGQTFDGQEFKNYFNLRAPANIQIVGPLFNVEKR